MGFDVDRMKSLSGQRHEIEVEWCNWKHWTDPVKTEELRLKREAIKKQFVDALDEEQEKIGAWFDIPSNKQAVNNLGAMMTTEMVLSGKE